MLAIGRSVFRPRLHSRAPVAAFSTAADRAATPDGPAEVAEVAEADAAGAAAPSAADAASAVPASMPNARMSSRRLVPMPLPAPLAAGQQGQACQQRHAM